MHYRLQVVLWIFVCQFGLVSEPVRAQLDRSIPRIKRGDGTSIRELQPKMFYLRNAQGELVYVPDFSYEQWERLIQLDRNLGSPRLPTSVLTEWRLEAWVEGDHLRAEAQFFVERRGARNSVRPGDELAEPIGAPGTTKRGDDEGPGDAVEDPMKEGIPPGTESNQVDERFDGDRSASDSRKEPNRDGREESRTTPTWVRVPLAMVGCFLRGEPEFEGTGSYFLSYEGAKDGYVCWLKAEPNTRHRMTLPLVVPVNRDGDERQISVVAPSPLVSRLTLHVPFSQATGEVSDGSTQAVRALEFSSDGDGGTFVSRGVRGPATVTWQGGPSNQREQVPPLDIFGALVVTANQSLQELRVDGQFTVRSFGQSMDRFQVRLPPALRLRSAATTGYRVRAIDEEDRNGSVGQLVEVRLEHPITSEATIRLSAELPAVGESSGEAPTLAELLTGGVRIEVARFEFPQAARHRGQIDFVAIGDWAYLWSETANAQRVDSTLDPIAGQPVIARFQYAHQPCDLAVGLSGRATKIHVEPSYDVHVGAQQTRLTLTLSCRSQGSNSSPIAVGLRGWTVEVVRFAETDSLLPIDFSQNDPLVVPVPMEAQSDGQYTLQIEARREMTAGVIHGTQPLQVLLPIVEAVDPSRSVLMASPADVTITPARNVSLTPRPSELQALAPLEEPDALSPIHEIRNFRYRDRGSAEQARFVGEFKIQPRAVSVSVVSNVHVDENSYAVDQTYQYAVQHEPIDHLFLAVPRRLVEDDRVNVRVMLDDEPLVPIPGPILDDERMAVRVELPRPALGPFQLSLTQSQQVLPVFKAERATPWTIPLVFPSTASDSSTTIIHNTVQVAYRDSLQFEVLSEHWSVDERSSGPGRLALNTASDGTDISMSVVRKGVKRPASTIVHNVWIQSWFAGQQRRDRVVFRLQTNEPELRIQLPNRALLDPRLVHVALDGQAREDCQLVDGGELIVPVAGPVSNEQDDRVLELWYVLSIDRLGGHTTIDTASIDAVDHAQRSFWQVVLPRGQLVFSADRETTSEIGWRWLGFGWGRKPLREQEELEHWIGASRQDPLPTATTRYLFTAFGSARHLEFDVISRSSILLISSGIVLVVGLSLLYVRIVRHPAALMLFGVILLTIGIAAPGPTLVIAQAASAGVALVCLAQLLRHLLGPRPLAPLASAGRSATIDSKVFEVHYSPGEGSSRITSSKNLVETPLSTADSKS